ncbi:MAG: nucleobase:cation symporter-2 family protein [Deltaproteobacteria bacterium]
MRSHPVDEKLPLGALFIYGLQHVLAMYVGAVAVPLFVAREIGLTDHELIQLINADLFTCGVATLIQTLGLGKNIGIRLPIIQGVSFVAVAPIILVGKTEGMPAVYGAIILAGLLTAVISTWFGKIVRFFPDRVVGTVICLIGLTLMPVALRWASSNAFLALFVLLTVVLFQRFLKGHWKTVSVLLGLIAGTLVSIPLGLISFSEVAKSDWLGLTLPFAFGVPRFHWPAFLSMSLVMIVIMIETTGDFIAIGEVVEKPVSENDLARGLRADGISTLLGGIFNSFPYTAYAQNVGLVSLTGVKSRFVVAAAGVILIALGLFPKAAAMVAAIPAPVLGGCGVAMFGMVMTSGITTLSRVKLRGTFDGLAVGVSLAIGMVPVFAPELLKGVPESLQVISQSGVTLGSLAILLFGFISPKESSSFSSNGQE